MSSITGALRQVQRAAGLPGLLAAARQAFEVMLAEIEEWQDPDSALFTVYVMAAGYAADGRDAIISAPSTPALTPAPEPDPLSCAYDVPVGLAEMIFQPLMAEPALPRTADW